MAAREFGDFMLKEILVILVASGLGAGLGYLAARAFPRNEI